MKVTLWYRHDKKSDSFKYNHLESGGHFENSIPEGSTPKNHKNFKSYRWLKEYGFLKNGKVIYKKED